MIELMVVVAIVGVLSAVGLPALTKAQDKAKDSAAIAKVSNGGKECASSLVTAGDGSIYEKGRELLNLIKTTIFCFGYNWMGCQRCV